MTKHPKTLSALKSSLLAEFEERLADYHIRGCKLLDESTAKMCERHRKKTEEFFSHALSTVAEKTAEEIFWGFFQRDSSMLSGLPSKLDPVSREEILEIIEEKRNQWLKGKND